MAKTNVFNEAVVYDSTGKLVKASTLSVATNHDSYQPAVAANFGPTTLLTASISGLHEISYYIVNVAQGSGADSVGQLVFNYTDTSGANAVYANMPASINATILGQGSVPVYLVAGSTVTCTLGSGVFAGGLAMDIAINIQHI